MGAKKVNKAIDAAIRKEAHHVAHTTTEVAMASGMIIVPREIATGFIWGLEVGLRLAIADIAAGRRLITRMDEEYVATAAKLNMEIPEVRGTSEAADRLLKVLSQ
jgi:hypothetical protein